MIWCQLVRILRAPTGIDCGMMFLMFLMIKRTVYVRGSSSLSWGGSSEPKQGSSSLFGLGGSLFTVSPGGNKPMCVFYHTCVVKTQHLPVCYFHICVVISTHMCERAHMCGKNHTSCPRVVCGVYHTCVGKTFVLSFFETFPSHFFRMTPKNVCMGRCVVAIIAFVWLLLCCAFSNVSSKPIQSCICLTFPRDMFWNIPSDCLSKWMQNHIISCICLNFPRCVFSNVSSNCQPERMHIHIGCICLFFSIVPFQMYPQSACLWGCIVTLVAFVWFNVIVGLFLQDFLNLQTKVIMFKSLFHYVVFCPNGSFKLIQINYLFLVNNHIY